MAEAKEIDWKLRMAEVIKDSSEMQTDITFKIEEGNNKEADVKAHRLVLGMASGVFRKMLFVTGTNDKEANEVSVKETTVAAFRGMVDAIYNTKTIHESLEDRTVHEMFAVVNLVKKYEIPELVLATRDCLATFPLNEEVVLEVAGDAIKYRDIFDEEAKELLLRCAKFLQPKFSDVQAVFKFGAANKEHADTIVELFALMVECDNCSQNPCRDGQEVTEGEIRLGLKVVFSHSHTYDSFIGIRGTVAGIKKVQACQAGSRLGVDRSIFPLSSIPNGIPIGIHNLVPNGNDGAAHSVGRGSTAGRRDRAGQVGLRKPHFVDVTLKDYQARRGQVNPPSWMEFSVKYRGCPTFRFHCETA